MWAPALLPMAVGFDSRATPAADGEGSEVRSFLRAWSLASSECPDDSRRLRRLIGAGSAERGREGAEAAGRGGEPGLDDVTRGGRLHWAGRGDESAAVDSIDSSGCRSACRTRVWRRGMTMQGLARDERARCGEWRLQLELRRSTWR